MNFVVDETHNPKTQSWVESANVADTDFPIQNLPFGVFSLGPVGPGAVRKLGVAIGDRILDLSGIKREGLLDKKNVGDAASLDGVSDLFLCQANEICDADSLNLLMSLGWGLAGERSLRRRLHAILRNDAPIAVRLAASRHLVDQADVEMLLPAAIGDYTDFYASIYHATNVGKLFRPDNPLLPNYKYIPIGYHGRASSIVPSGTPVLRPCGQTRDSDSEPKFHATKALDYELELGLLVGTANDLGDRVPLSEAEQHIFGVCLVNDWSARDIQAWEYQPLGPFLGKSFATTLSPWVVTMNALAPFRTAAFVRPQGDPPPLPYLDNPADRQGGGLDLWLEVSLLTPHMRGASMAPLLLGKSNFRDMYWTMAQMLTHHTSNGCNLRTGDLLASGTVSGADKTACGSLLELTQRGKEPITLPTGEVRKFLEDGDEVIIRGYCEREGFRRIGLGSCRGTILPTSKL